MPPMYNNNDSDAKAGLSNVDLALVQSPEISLLADQLLPIFYAELRRVAHHERSRIGGSFTMQTTDLVHETYLKLHKTRGWNDDSHFMRAAALAMRHALINNAQARVAAKRGSGAHHISLTAEHDLAIDDDESLLSLNEALQRLAMQSPRLANVVECRYFAGYGERETARALDVSERTVRRDWTLARAWLHRELSDEF